MMNKFKKTFFPALVLLFTVLISFPASSQEPGAAVIDEVAVSRTPSLAVSFTVKDAFTEDMEEAIRSGLPAAFNFIVVLERKNSVWFNEEVARREFTHTVKYDSLKDEYEVALDETGKTVRTKDFNEMKKLMSEGSPVQVFPKSALVPGAEYEFRIMAELKTIRPPFLLDYMLFVRKWDFETDWHIYRFSP